MLVVSDCRDYCFKLGFVFRTVLFLRHAFQSVFHGPTRFVDVCDITASSAGFHKFLEIKGVTLDLKDFDGLFRHGLFLLGAQEVAVH